VSSRQEIAFEVEGFPPAKSEALSMLGTGHPHAPRVVALLEAAKRAIDAASFQPLSGRVALEVVLRAPDGVDPWDATNYLGGIADVLEDKSRRGAMPLAHLGDLARLALYGNDRQIREIHYRQHVAPVVSYAVRVYSISGLSSGP
jgi:hypothetical protein